MICKAKDCSSSKISNSNSVADARDSLDQRRRSCSLPYYNTEQHQDVEHLGMSTNMIEEDHSTHHSSTNLGLMTTTSWRRLTSYVKKLKNNRLQTCCFQCGMLLFEQEAQSIKITNVQNREDCRAYRVFKYFIQHRALDEASRLSSSQAGVT